MKSKPIDLNAILKALPLEAVDVIEKCARNDVGEALKLLTFTYGMLPRSPRNFLPMEPETECRLQAEFFRRFIASDYSIDWKAVRFACQTCKQF